MADRDTPARCRTCDQWKLTRSHVCPSAHQAPIGPHAARITAAVVTAVIVAALVGAYLAGADTPALIGLSLFLGVNLLAFMYFAPRPKDLGAGRSTPGN